MLIVLVAILIATRLITALGIPKVLTFTSSNTALTLASAQHLLPILIDSSDAEAVHIAVSTFADDVMRVFGARPEVHTDSLPEGTSCAILAATVGSAIMRKVRGKAASQQTGQKPLRAEGDELEGKWEAFDVRVVDQPMQGLGEALVIAGSDRVNTVKAKLNSRLSS
jgi:hypothetical protein